MSIEGSPDQGTDSTEYVELGLFKFSRIVNPFFERNDSKNSHSLVIDPRLNNGDWRTKQRDHEAQACIEFIYGGFKLY